MSSKNRQTFAGLPTIEANDHDEKSSQRVPGPYILLFFGFYLLLTYTIIVIEDAMPTVIRERDIANDDSNTFSEETAKVYLNRILGGQPRVAGTLFHLIKTRDMKDIVDEIANKANIPVRTDWQFVSGDYWLASSSSHVNCYQNVSNVIAVLEGESGFHPNGTIGTSLLVNCHYDSVPFAIGASDNGVFCAVMAETLSKLSRRKEKLKHNIIFLFNGAEESALMGSHGFLSHPWAKGVTNVVNLDSAGMNGKPSVFQVTDPRVLKAYKRTCSKPNAQGLGEVLFASGVIPSDTDFRIFRDFGNIHGIDIAFIKGGNVYHTRNDRPELIQDGVIQNAGNMLLSLVRELADSEELENKESKSTVVYYDYMGLFMVTYSRTTGLVVDILIGLLGLSSVVYFLWLFGLRRSSVIELLWSVLGRIVCVLFGLAVVALNTVVMVATTTQMRYLSEQWLVVPLYIGPFVIAMTVASHAFDSWRARKRSASRSWRASRAQAASRAVLAAALLLQCAFPQLTNVRYVVAAPLLPMALGGFVSLTVVGYRRLAGWQHLMLEVVLLLPATSLCVSLAARLLSLLVPIMGRSGSDAPDYTVAAVTVALASLAVATVSGVELLFGGRVCVSLLFASLLSVCAAFAPLSPYRGYTTQRHFWYHSQITTYDANLTARETVTGVLVSKLDAHSAQAALRALRGSALYGAGGGGAFQITDSDLIVYSADKCEKYIYCDLPLYKPRKGSLFIKMGPPAEYEHSLTLANRTCDADSCALSFIMRGPAYNTLSVWPRPATPLRGWSLGSPLRATVSHEGRPLFVITHCTATYSEVFQPLEFTLTFSVPRDFQSDILADISHHAHRVYHPQYFTTDYKKLLGVMPEYFNIATYLSFRTNYVF
ncbi:putative endoplasmic reticulum metallopeptidase 1-A isoform X3 [Vanessa atalanta]|uniref:putative endoplasmic reticulum metallopeptidase 1-A isoform X3 n=1 Tax=Vanessa atalanta TaxID=42275 RepID=UPI001FCE2076|nr:putative endoplasmic reticulum metallopeptidase 1-A isoform X3 [Vanessa atalanta]